MNTTLIRRTLIAAALAVWTGSVSAAPLFTDSFEAPENTQSWQVYSDFGLWSTSSGPGIEIQTNSAIPGTATPFGDQYVELDSYANSAMTRTLALGPGRYEIAFFYLPRTSAAGDNRIDVFLDADLAQLGSSIVGSADGVRSAASTWTREAYEVTVDGMASQYGLTFAAGGTSNSLGGFVDNVSLSQIPIPATLGLLGAGLIGLGLTARRPRA